jgi:hypothetical protein
MERLHDQLIHELMQTFEEKLSAAAEADGNAKHNIKLRRDDGGAVVLVTSAWPAASPYFWGGRILWFDDAPALVGVDYDLCKKEDYAQFHGTLTVESQA